MIDWGNIAFTTGWLYIFGFCLLFFAGLFPHNVELKWTTRFVLACASTLLGFAVMAMMADFTVGRSN